MSLSLDAGARPLLYRAAQRGVFGECRRYPRGSISDALFVYLDGEPDPESVPAVEETYTNRPLVCLTDAWEQFIREHHPEAAVFRRHMMKPRAVFRFPEERPLPEDCRLSGMDRAAFGQHPFSHGGNYPSFEVFQSEGSGAVVYCGDDIVASASSFLSLDGEVELDVSTREEHRGKGLAEACVARMLRDCAERGIVVHWDAQNDISLHLAEKYGFEPEADYHVYWLPGSGRKEEVLPVEDVSLQHKKAWEYDAYNFWVRQSGTPEERAREDMADPRRMLRKYADYFDRFEDVRIANICGSCGKKAVPLALLGADVTVFDISEDNKRYATETAQAAHVRIGYEVCDIMKIDLSKYAGYFDVVFMEGGILAYFHDLDRFMGIMHALLKPGGKMICSDFHPFIKIMDSLKLETQTMSYFSTEVFEGEMAHARFYDEETRKQFPRCRYRRYTISEIINAIIRQGFTLQRFDEHPAWEDQTLPGEFTAVAVREA